MLHWFFIVKIDNEEETDEYLSSFKMKGDYFV